MSWVRDPPKRHASPGRADGGPVSIDVFDLIQKIAAGGFATLLTALLVSGKYGWWLYGTTHKEIVDAKDKAYADMVKEKDEQIQYHRTEARYWRDLTIDIKNIAARSTTVAAKVVGAPE